MPSMDIVLMLEDDDERLRRFTSVLKGVCNVEFRFTKSAHSFIELYSTMSTVPALICLDHDLYPELDSDPDPGDGRMVAEFLATKAPGCHVVIHSSNFAGAESMLYTLLDAGWSAERVAPLGEDWIEAYWWPIAKHLLQDRTKR